MTAITATKAHTPLRSKLVLTLLLAGALLTMGAKWAEKPIETLASIAGEWRGGGITAAGRDFSITYVFKEDGSFDYDITSATRKGHRPPGTLSLSGGKVEYENERGMPYTITLYEGKKGKRKLEGLRVDGLKWTLKPRK